MTQVFREDGTVVPVTRVQAGPCVVTQVKKEGKDTAKSVQVGLGEQKSFRLTRAIRGHLKDLSPVRHMREFRVDDTHGLYRGDVLTVKTFEIGEKVQVTGTSKGRGFQGVVKRHGFHGSPATHGHKDQLRMPGSIGAGGVQRVFKGKRMGGHMGDARVTVKNLEIVSIDADNNELLIKGAVPGARGGILMIYTDAGKMTPEVPIAEEVLTDKEANSTIENVSDEVVTVSDTVEEVQSDKNNEDKK